MANSFLVRAAAFQLCGVLALPSLVAGDNRDPLGDFTRDAPTLEQLNVPGSFKRLVRDRKIIDLHAGRRFSVANGPLPTPVAFRSRRSRSLSSIHVLTPAHDPSAANQPTNAPDNASLLPGIRAPLRNAVEAWLPPPSQFPFKPHAVRETIRIIEDQLAHVGLLRTLVSVIDVLGPEHFVDNDQAGIAELYALGLPVDLLACFSARGYSDTRSAATEVIRRISSLMLSDADLYALEGEMNAFHFHSPGFWPQFRVATESGSQELGLIRLQLGGGYRDGIIPGEAIHVTHQLITRLPQTDFFVVAPERIGPALTDWANETLRLRSTQNVSILMSRWEFDSWAQDNGRAGSIHLDGRTAAERATLVPRFASRDEGISTFLAGETFLMNEIQDQGHQVVQSPLLFQGGDLLAVLDPKTRQRILLLGEGEIHRNTALGLSQLQVLQLFKDQFAVDECRIIPALSYHLDLDITAREVNGELVIFVNDPLPVVTQVLDLGIHALKNARMLPMETASILTNTLASGQARRFLDAISSPLAGLRMKDGRFPAAVAQAFRSNSQDWGEGNFQGFLQALDLYLVLNHLDAPTGDVEDAAYFAALKRWNRARLAQLEAVERLGWRTARIPSTPDLFRNINYINGIHYREGYIMPAFGGFYSRLDASAEEAFRNVMGTETRLIPIHCAQLQYLHGAIHCVVSAYPPPRSDD